MKPYVRNGETVKDYLVVNDSELKALQNTLNPLGLQVRVTCTSFQDYETGKDTEIAQHIIQFRNPYKDYSASRGSALDAKLQADKDMEHMRWCD